MDRQLACLDPLLGCAPLIIETHYRPGGQAQIRDDEANSRKQLSDSEVTRDPWKSTFKEVLNKS